MREPSAEEYAEDHNRFLEQNRPDVLDQLRRSSDLNSYLSSVGEQAEDRYRTLISQYQHSKAVQDLPYLEQVQALQSRRREANEVVRHDLIYQPLPDADAD